MSAKMSDPKVTPQILRAAEAIVKWLSDDNTQGTDASDEELIEKFSSLICAHTGAECVQSLIDWCKYLTDADPARTALEPDAVCPSCAMHFLRNGHSENCGLNNLLTRLAEIYDKEGE